MGKKMHYFSMKLKKKFLTYSTNLLMLWRQIYLRLTLAFLFRVLKSQKMHFSRVRASPSILTLFDIFFIETQTLSSFSSSKSCQSPQKYTYRSSLPSKYQFNSRLGAKLKNATSDGASSLLLQLLGEGSPLKSSMMSSQWNARSN